MLKWLEGNGFTLCNQPYVPTREDTMGHTSIIDLTFKNMAANGANILREFQVDTNSGTLSDHHAIGFQLRNPNTIVLNPTTNRLNWKHADEEEFTDTLSNVLAEDKQNYDLIV